LPATGRPAWKPSSKDREVVRMMTAVGVDQEQICCFFKITQKTLRKHCRDEIDGGVVEANLAVGRSMHQMALRAPYATRFQAARYWLACRGGWRDGDRVTIVTVPKASFEMSDDEITTLIAREEAYRAACEKAAANGTTVVPFPYTPPPPRRKR
jgi:hypothetical protein